MMRTLRYQGNEQGRVLYSKRAEPSDLKLQLNSGFRPRRFQRADLATRQFVQVPLSSAG